MIDGYLTTRQAAEKLGVTIGRIQQLVAEKKIKAQKVGRDNLIKEADLDSIKTYGKAGRPPKAKDEK
jgi:excisionase family DNA binding protein